MFGFGAIRGADFAVELVDVCLHRADFNEQRRSDLLIGVPGSDMVQDLALLLSELLEYSRLDGFSLHLLHFASKHRESFPLSPHDQQGGE